MGQAKLARVADSTLVIIDVQERLAAVMAERETVVARMAILVEAAKLLDVPVVVTEQYPKGLGPTDARIAAALPPTARIVEKSRFSACGALALDRDQVILTGMEAHVCVLQTALELAAAHRQVFVVADAVCSRDSANRRNGLARLRQEGVTITNTESMVFEWLRESTHAHFRTLSKLIR